jgi:hypothetical protein
VQDLFVGDGAFLALPPRCVPDRHITKMPSEVVESWLGLLDVAWRALDDRARRALDTLVQSALARQPLLEDVLALETLESGTGTTPISLSTMFNGWSAPARNLQDSENRAIATLMEQEAYGDVTVLDTPSATTRITNKAEEANDAEMILQKETEGNVGDGLFDDLDFDDRLSQEI